MGQILYSTASEEPQPNGADLVFRGFGHANLNPDGGQLVDEAIKKWFTDNGLRENEYQVTMMPDGDEGERAIIRKKR